MMKVFTPTIDLRSEMTEVKDQGQRPSCVAFAVTASNEFYQKSKNPLSEEFLFRCCKIRDKNEYGGTYVRTAMKNLYAVGQVEESVMPYQTGFSSSPLLSTINLGFFRLARKNRIDEFKQVPKEIGFVEKNISYGRPVVCVVEVRDEFFEPSYSFIDIQESMSQSFPLHAIVIVGYGLDNFGQKYFIIRNSWGSEWGTNGHGYLSYLYYKTCCIENWVVGA